MKAKNKIPEFLTEEDEQKFWQENDTADFIDWKQGKKVRFTNLMPSTKTISLRLPESLLDDIKILAHKNDIPYQSLIKIFIKDRIDNELGHI
jgi:predicted DNA binding CopG/RHH family protein